MTSFMWTCICTNNAVDYIHSVTIEVFVLIEQFVTYISSDTMECLWCNWLLIYDVIGYKYMMQLVTNIWCNWLLIYDVIDYYGMYSSCKYVV